MRVKRLKLLLIGYTLIIGFAILLYANKSYNLFIPAGTETIPIHWQRDYNELNEIEYEMILEKLDVKSVLSSSSADLKSVSYLGMPKTVLNITYSLLFLWTIVFILHLNIIKKVNQ